MRWLGIAVSSYDRAQLLKVDGGAWIRLNSGTSCHTVDGCGAIVELGTDPAKILLIQNIFHMESDECSIPPSIIVAAIAVAIAVAIRMS